MIQESRQIQREREERRRLQEQQDFAYNESLRLDREREERMKREADERARVAEEAEEAKALQEAMEMSKQLTKEENYRIAKERLLEEPAAGSECARLVLKLPDGSRVIRRFPRLATLQNVRDFVNITVHQKQLNITNYTLNSNFPKKTFGEDEEDLNVNLSESGLYPEATLFVHNLDS